VLKEDFCLSCIKEILDRLSPNSLHKRIWHLSPLSKKDSKNLRVCQKDAIEGLEKLLKQNKEY